MSIERTPLQERLTAVVRRFPQRKVVVVGDLVADQFLYGEISRVSREAPVLILKYERTETKPGGAANCAVNLSSLDAKAVLVGFTGDDEPGRSLLQELQGHGVNCDGVIAVPAHRTTTKVRILAGQVHSTRQQVIRIDYEGETVAESALHGEMCERVRSEIATADAVIISDYHYGVASDQMAAAIRDATRDRGIPVLVDSRFRLTSFPSFTSATPNEDEVEQLLGRPLAQAGDIEAAASELCERLGYRALLVTRGGFGMILLEEGNEAELIPAVGSREPVDVTGAGDTVIATYSLALATGASFSDAAHLANHAGGLVVMKRGTASINRQELLSSVLRWAET